MHDLIIVGGGPAGLAASVYAARKQLETLGVPIGRGFKLIKGWKDRLIGSEITEQQKKQFWQGR